MIKANRSQRFWLMMILLLLVVAWFGTRKLDDDSFWVDEIWTAQRAGDIPYGVPLSLAEIWARTGRVSDQAPGYYIVVAGWRSLVGLSEFAGRSLSWLFGMLTIAWIYRLGHDLHSELAGFAAAVALSSSAYYILFLREMRAYAMIVWLTTLLLWFYWRIKTGHRDLLSQVGVVLSTAGLLYSHYFSIVLIAALCLYHLLFVPKNREWWRIVLLIGLAGALFVPWLVTSFWVFNDPLRNSDRGNVSYSTVEAFQNIASYFSNESIAFLTFIGVFALQRHKAVVFIWSVLAVSMTITILLNMWMGFLGSVRYVLVLWVPLSLLVGFGVVGLERIGVRPIVILALLFAVGIWNTLDPSVAERINLPIRYLPWRELRNTVSGRGQEGDVLLFLPLIEGNDWEGGQEFVAAHYMYGTSIRPEMLNDVRNLPDVDFLREAARLIADAPRVWLAYAPKLRSWRTGMLQDWLVENDYAYCGNVADTPQLYLDLFARRPADDRDMTLYFGTDTADERIALQQLEPISGTVHDKLSIAQSWWLGDAVPRYTYSAAVHIKDRDGNVVAQTDYGLSVDTYSCVTADIALNDLAPGDYSAFVVVYAWETGERLTATSRETGEQGESMLLGHFTITD